ncbi:MAG: TonB-dependent receptor [Steroidobacteraceae bacterium]
MNRFLAPRTTHSTLAVAIAMTLAATAQANDPMALEEVVITGTRATLRNAIEAQREANVVSSVVDSDAAGDFADINIAESLRRVPGIMVENDQGEGRYVSVRGMNADLNAMTINGVSTASPEDRRGIMLDGVPTDMLESMTVYKTLMPNMDADSIGGAIDIQTISAFKHDGAHLRIKAETSYNEQTESADNPKLALIATNRWALGAGELGAALTLSHQERQIVSYNNETGGWSADSVALDTDYEMRFYDLVRERQGVVLNLDYRGDSGRNYYAKLFHNEYTDTEYRAKWEVRRSIENDAIVNGDVFTYPNQRIDTEARGRDEVREISSAQLGFEAPLGDSIKIKAELFGSRAEQDDRDQANVIFRSSNLATPLTYDNSNPKKPVLNFTEALYDPASFEMNAFEAEFALTKDEDVGFRIDLTHAWSDATELQYGVKYRARKKTNDFNFCGYEPIEDVSLADFDNATIGRYFGNVHGPSPTFRGTRALLGTLGSDSFALADGTRCPTPGTLWDVSGDENEESIPADWYSDEDVLSGYVMATTVLDRVTMVYGLRYEDTRASFRGKGFDGDNYLGLVSFDKNYGFLAPSFNLKYELAEDRLLRFGVFRSLVRPGFGESAAGAIIDLEDNEIQGGNPALDPTQAWNVDLSFEWYAGRETFFSAGVFYKRIEDSIIEVAAVDSELRGQVWSLAETFVNGEDSSITGFELAFQTAFDNGLFLVLNYTHADGETDLPADSPYGARTIPYFKQAKSTYNASVGYDKGPWDIRLSANYRDDYLDEIGEGALADRYTSEFMQVDLKAKYKVSDKLELMAAIINLNDRPEFYYFGNRSRLSQYDEFGATYELGVAYTF